MKLKKIGVALLVLLLMMSVVVSLAVAQDITSGKGILGVQDRECTSCSIPETGGFVSYESGSEDNLLREFGIGEPKTSFNVSLRSYDEAKDLVDEIIEKSKFNIDPGAVIGLYDMDQYQILLIDRGDTMLEAIYDGDSVTTYDVIPELLGEKKLSYSPKKVSIEGKNTENFCFTTETLTRLYSVPIRSPDSDTTMADQYTVTKTRTDEYKDGLMVRGKLVTKGVFYVDYGQKVAGITDQTTWNVYTPWSKCEYSSSSSGSGSTSGQVDGHLKIGMLYNRAQMDGWVSCNAWLTTDDGGSQNAWVSVIDDGCSS
ncbi:hypothetical protein RJ40_02160 [Methanofollis aquaemaris]|uniref:Uncharacterized protein n=1 Tax=Methanofollis aquaemaris TaxID=126734 RepID=A0A8A3S417_9EURY|nr:hypothetical protein [Methanofollis aquaemaris]QSZ66386.1 hypothetical protein RJ40_02160 [Methanofollis aquaemaris]